MDTFDLFYYLSQPIVLFPLLLLFFAFLASFIFRNYFSKIFKFNFVFNKVILLISVPKDSGIMEMAKNQLKKYWGQLKRFGVILVVLKLRQI